MKDKQNTYRNHSGIGLFITFFLYKAHPTSAGVERDGLGQKKKTPTGFAGFLLVLVGFQLVLVVSSQV